MLTATWGLCGTDFRSPRRLWGLLVCKRGGTGNVFEKVGASEVTHEQEIITIQSALRYIIMGHGQWVT